MSGSLIPVSIKDGLVRIGSDHAKRAKTRNGTGNGVAVDPLLMKTESIWYLSGTEESRPISNTRSETNR